MSQGRKQKPEPALFVPGLDIYRHIRKDHFYEQLSRVLDLEFVRELTRPLYAERIGRPSLDPVVFFKCMLVAFFENIVSDEELEFRLADSLVLRRFLGYGLEERTPDESTLRKTRQRMPDAVFLAVFTQVLRVCDAHGMVKGRALGTDSTLIDANASMDSLVHKELGCTYEEFMLALRRQDKPDATKGEAKNADRERKGKASNAQWESPTDPDARIGVHADKHTHLSYAVHTTVDLETGVVVSTGADLANASDQQACLGRVDEAVAAVEELGKEPVAVVADKGHHSGENVAGIEERGLVPLVSSPQTAQGPEGFRREDFTYDAKKDQLTCPAGRVLGRKDRRNPTSRVYRCKPSVCRACPHFGVCTQSKSGRQVAISIYEEQVAANRQRVRSEAARPLMQIRRQRGEAPFSYYKQYGGLRRLSGHGLGFAEKKALMAAAGWNLMLLVKRLMREGALASASALLALFWALWGALERFWGAPGRVLGPSAVQEAEMAGSGQRTAPLPA